MNNNEIDNFNTQLIKRKIHEPQKPISNKRRYQSMVRYLHSIGVK